MKTTLMVTCLSLMAHFVVAEVPDNPSKKHPIQATAKIPALLDNYQTQESGPRLGSEIGNCIDPKSAAEGVRWVENLVGLYRFAAAPEAPYSFNGSSTAVNSDSQMSSVYQVSTSKTPVLDENTYINSMVEELEFKRIPEIANRVGVLKTTMTSDGFNKTEIKFVRAPGEIVTLTVISHPMNLNAEQEIDDFIRSFELMEEVKN